MTGSNLKHTMSIDSLDDLIDTMGITADESELPPIYDDERAMIKIQLLAALIIVKDIMVIRCSSDGVIQQPNNAIDELCNNWAQNIKIFAKAILNNPEFQLDIEEILKDIQKNY